MESKSVLLLSFSYVFYLFMYFQLSYREPFQLYLKIFIYSYSLNLMLKLVLILLLFYLIILKFYSFKLTRLFCILVNSYLLIIHMTKEILQLYLKGKYTNFNLFFHYFKIRSLVLKSRSLLWLINWCLFLKNILIF